MTDEIIYQMPFGILGSIAHVIFVRRTLHRIFDYRRRKLNELFPLPEWYGDRVFPPVFHGAKLGRPASYSLASFPRGIVPDHP